MTFVYHVAVAVASSLVVNVPYWLVHHFLVHRRDNQEMKRLTRDQQAVLTALSTSYYLSPQSKAMLHAILKGEV